MTPSSTERRIGVVLMNLGGPTSRAAVRPFLESLFGDPDIIKLGGGVKQRALAKTIAKFRAPKVATKYEEIAACPAVCLGNEHCENKGRDKVLPSCCSPINPLTELQRRTLQRTLRAALPGRWVKVYTAMRYWLPSTETTVADMLRDGVTDVVLLTLYPHFSWTTTGSSLREWEKVRRDQTALGKPWPWTETQVKDYFLHDEFLAAVEDRLEAGLARFAPEDRQKVQILFTAHGTPVAERESGDPYTSQVERTVNEIMRRRGETSNNWWVSYQSKVGPAKWVQPNTEDLVMRLIDYGAKHFLMVPIAFVTDHIETLHELGIELGEAVEESGRHVEQIVVTEGLNDHPRFMSCLADLVLTRLNLTAAVASAPVAAER